MVLFESGAFSGKDDDTGIAGLAVGVGATPGRLRLGLGENANNTCGRGELWDRRVSGFGVGSGGVLSLDSDFGSSDKLFRLRLLKIRGNVMVR